MKDIIDPNTDFEKASYNYFLYQKRVGMGLSRRKMAKILDIPPIHYGLLEKGYLKPNKKDIRRISDYFGLDFGPYLEDERSYPTELPESQGYFLSRLLYRILGLKGIRIALGALAVLFIAAFVTGEIGSAQIGSHPEAYYSESVLMVKREIMDSGSFELSIITSFMTPSISITEKDKENSREKFISASTSTNENNLSFEFEEIHWSDDYRIHIGASGLGGGDLSSFSINLLDYDEGASHFALLSDDGKNIDVVFTQKLSEEKQASYLDYIHSCVQPKSLENDFTRLFREKTDISAILGHDFDVISDFVTPLGEGNAKLDTYSMVFAFSELAGIIFGGLSIFGFFYAVIYGQRSHKVRVYLKHGDELLGFEGIERKPKKDIRFTPFLPETFLEIVGIVLVFIGGLRITALASNILVYSQSTLDMANQLLSIQMLGMFLLYFIDFDLFMDDNRVLRNVILYPILFIIVYYFEATLMSSIAASQSVSIGQLTRFLMPNPFFSVTCYFLIMMFLFFTPRWIKTKRGLIVYRSMAVLPIIYIVVAFILGHGNTFFDWEENYWFLYFFQGERLPFSILAVSYLVGLFFLRLHFKRKYGEEEASRYFMGNRFIMLKNIMTALIIVAVWAMEMILSGNKTLNKIGIGTNTYLIFLAPLMLFYHPHKGPRNLAVDWITLGLYFLALVISYALGVLTALISLVS